MDLEQIIKEHNGIEKLSSYERETIIIFNDSDQMAQIYSCSPKTIMQINSLCEEFPENYQGVSSDKYGCKYSCDKADISFKKHRYISEELRRKMANTMRENRKKRLAR